MYSEIVYSYILCTVAAAAGKDTVKRYKAQRNLPTIKTKGTAYTLAAQESLQLPLSTALSTTTSLSAQQSQVQLLNSALEPTSSQFLPAAVSSSNQAAACNEAGPSNVTVTDGVNDKEDGGNNSVNSSSHHHSTVLASLEHAKAPVMADGFPVDDTQLTEEDDSGHGNMMEFKETAQEV